MIKLISAALNSNHMGKFVHAYHPTALTPELVREAEEQYSIIVKCRYDQLGDVLFYIDSDLVPTAVDQMQTLGELDRNARGHIQFALKSIADTTLAQIESAKMLWLVPTVAGKIVYASRPLSTTNRNYRVGIVEIPVEA